MHNLLLTTLNENDDGDERIGPWMRSCGRQKDAFSASWKDILNHQKRSLVQIHASPIRHTFWKDECVCVGFLYQSCKGGALVTSPDFEVGGEEGGRGCGGGVQTAYPTACIDSSEKKTQIHDTGCLCEDITYNNTARIFRTALSRGGTGLRTGLSSS